MEDLLYHVILIISLVPHLSFSQDEDIFHCSAKPGCQISQCDPNTPAWNEFPITCKSKNSRKSNNNGFLLSLVQGNVQDIRNMRSEMKELEEQVEQNTELTQDLRSMKTEINELEELKKRNENLENELSTLERATTQELQELRKELLLLKRTGKISDRECFSSCKAARSADISNNMTTLCLPIIGSTDVRCDFETDNGDWIVILRRSDGSIDFNRNWVDYLNGFGILGSEFWFGLEKLHILTSNQKYELQIDMENFNGEKRFAKYSKFVVGPYSTKYKLTIGGYSGDSGDSFTRHHQKPFSTKDNDNDGSDNNCAELWLGGWWFTKCYFSHLTGLYVEAEATGIGKDGIKWNSWENPEGHSYSLQFVEMKIRPVE